MPNRLRLSVLRRRPALLAAFALAILALMAGAPAAQAGRYHVYSCRTPSGAAAPVDGWAGSSSGPFVYFN